jgi:hypothetical protein
MYTPFSILINRFFGSIIFIIFTSFIFLSCDSGEPNPSAEIDRGSYKINIYPSTLLRSYSDGAGVFIYELAPNSDFSGKVLLGVKNDSILNPKLTYNYINKSCRISEIFFRPSSYISEGNYPLVLFLKHNNLTQTVIVTVEILNYKPYLEFSLIQYKEFASYLEKNFPEYNIKVNDKWNIFQNYIPPMCFLETVFLDDRYQIIFSAFCNDLERFAIRRRNYEISPSLILEKEHLGSIHKK